MRARNQHLTLSRLLTLFGSAISRTDLRCLLTKAVETDRQFWTSGLILVLLKTYSAPTASLNPVQPAAASPEY